MSPYPGDQEVCVANQWFIFRKGNNMPVSTITVQDADGRPVKRATVVLGFVDEATEGDLTDGRGRVTVEHSATGKAVIIINRAIAGRFSAPGECLVTLK